MNVKLALNYFFGPYSSIQFRLVGPGSKYESTKSTIEGYPSLWSIYSSPTAFFALAIYFISVKVIGMVIDKNIKTR